MCLYVCAYVCVYVCICVYMYVCICMHAYLCHHHYQQLWAQRPYTYPMPVSSTSFNFLCPTPSVHICVCMHNTCICLGRNVRWENVLLKTGGGISGGELSGGELSGGELSGDYCPTLRSSIAKLQICANYSKIPTRACMDDRSSLDLELGSRAWRHHG